MATKKDARVILIQNIEPELWAEVEQFLGKNKRMRGKRGPLALAALESYLSLAKIYGIDSEWHLKIPKTGPAEIGPEQKERYASVTIGPENLEGYDSLAERLGRLTGGGQISPEQIKMYASLAEELGRAKARAYPAPEHKEKEEKTQPVRSHKLGSPLGFRRRSKT